MQRLNCTIVRVVALMLLTSVELIAAEYRVERLVGTVPAEELSPEIAAQLESTAFKVISGTSAARTLCELSITKAWAQQAGFKPSNTVQYAFQPGQLIGVVQYRRKGVDFRGQEIVKGTYTLRYAQQPEDGNHVGTSDTRDFLVLLKAESDRSPQPLAKEMLFKLSAAAAGTTHPCMLSLLAPGKGADEPKIELDEAKEWAILQIMGKGESGAIPMRLVIDGKAAE